jgi:PadR family transcriptional regulator PadR
VLRAKKVIRRVQPLCPIQVPLGKGETYDVTLIEINMKGTYLGEFEELVLLSVGILIDDAYGLSILSALEKQTNRTIMVSSVHKTLVRLEDKGYLRSYMGGATTTRGGRDKRLYQLTRAGIKALNQSRELRNDMWKQVPSIIWEGAK